MQEQPRKIKPVGTAEPSAQDEFFSGVDEYGDEAQVSLRRNKRGKRPNKKKKKKHSLTVKLNRWVTEQLDGTAPKKKKKRKKLFHIRRTKDKKLRGLYFNDTHLPLKILIAVGLIASLATITFFDGTNPVVTEREISIVGLNPAFEGYKIMLLSDMNGKRFGDEQSSLLRRITNEGCNMLILLGDMIGKDGDPQPLYELLEGLPRSVKVYFICGDNDPGPYLDEPRNREGTLSELVLEDWILGAIERGATYVDKPIKVTKGEATLWLVPSLLMNFNASELKELWADQEEQETDGVLSGLSDDHNTLPITAYRARTAKTYYTTLKEMAADDFYIVLSHEVPQDNMILSITKHDTSDSLYLYTPDLLFAGHYCAGEWRLPLLGAIYIPNRSLVRNGWFPDETFVHGLRAVGETQVYTGGGLNVNQSTVMPFRFWNKPQIDVLSLTARLANSMLE